MAFVCFDESMRQELFGDKVQGHCTIPGYINGLCVLAIGENAFHLCTDMTSIEIPNGVTSIGKYKFYRHHHHYLMHCDLMIIGYCAFFRCTGLTTILIPNSVTSIGKYACYVMNEYSSSPLSKYSLTILGYCAFFKCSGLIRIEIPNGVKSIGKYYYS